MTSDRIQRLENIAQGYIDRGEFASVEWLVEAKGSTVTAGSVGVLTRKPCIPPRLIHLSDLLHD